MGNWGHLKSIFHKKKAGGWPGPHAKTPEEYQSELDNEMTNYEGIHKRTIEDANKEFDDEDGYRNFAQRNAVAGARERGEKDVSLAHIAALRASLGLPPLEEGVAPKE